jgi:sugar/nucleoside kinase (ribokinase family)
MNSRSDILLALLQLNLFFRGCSVSLLIAGTICFDTIETPNGRVDRVLGGSGVFAAVTASIISPPRLIGAVGNDFTIDAREMLNARRIDLSGVQVLPEVRTQFWHGRYHPGLHTREHIDVDLNILDRMDLVVPAEFRNSSHVFLAHMPPHHQHRVLDQLSSPEIVFADTIDHWIDTRRAEVIRLFERVTGVVVNDGEAELLTGERNPLRAARAIGRFGPKLVIVKKGEHGLLIYSNNEFIALPALPVEDVVDPTGAGDTFAGSMIASLESGQTFISSVASGIVAASMTVEGFGLSRLVKATRADLDTRLARYRKMLTF